MPLLTKDKQITSIIFRGSPISSVYHGAKLVWEAIRSCFGKGFWINEMPWSNDEGWENNK